MIATELLPKPKRTKVVVEFTVLVYPYSDEEALRIARRLVDDELENISREGWFPDMKIISSYIIAEP